ncbi:MAG: HAD family hydrolase, partial [Gammaproteobacteria bacterium]|nr:HAD family hydrolase [Gammaproteobacteria bacterium]
MTANREQPMPMPDGILERLRRVRLLGLDVDGVLTDGRLYYGPDNVELKAFHAQDGSAMKRLMASGIPIAIVTGRTSEAVDRRAAELGVPYLFAGVSDKTAAFEDLAARSAV